MAKRKTKIDVWDNCTGGQLRWDWSFYLDKKHQLICYNSFRSEKAAYKDGEAYAKGLGLEVADE
jgi:hypothetical protein